MHKNNPTPYHSFAKPSDFTVGTSPPLTALLGIFPFSNTERRCCNTLYCSIALLFADDFRINKKTSRNKRSNWFQFSQLPYLGRVILRLLSSFLLIILQQQEQQ